MYNDHSFLFKPLKESPQRVLLVETNVSVAVAVTLWASFSSQGIDPLCMSRHRSRHLTKNHNLAVLITERCAPKSQNFVDYLTHKTGKMLPHVKYFPPKGVIFSDFMLTFAMSCYDLYLL